MPAPSPDRRPLLRDPTLHVVVLGAALFAVDAWRRRPAPDARELVVPAAHVRAAREELTRRLGRAPTSAEVRGELDGFVREEVLYREALALGLERGDTIVRRRLVQKMESLAEDLSDDGAPTDAELTAWLRAHADRYAAPGRVSFRHVFFDRGRRGARLDADARDALASLRNGAAAAGDPFALGATFTDADDARVARDFGEDFARSLTALPADGRWQGPVASPFGAHLVAVSARTPGELPPLDRVRERVAADLAEARREEGGRSTWRALARGYRVRVEGL